MTKTTAGYNDTLSQQEVEHFIGYAMAHGALTEEMERAYVRQYQQSMSDGLSDEEFEQAVAYGVANGICDERGDMITPSGQKIAAPRDRSELWTNRGYNNWDVDEHRGDIAYYTGNAVVRKLPQCPYCGSTSGAKDSRGKCACCGGDFHG